MSTRRNEIRRIRTVIQYPQSRRSRNRFVGLLADGMGAHGVATGAFHDLSARMPTFSDAMVLHWPENLLQRNSLIAVPLASRMLSYLERSQDAGTTVIWFLHNSLRRDLSDHSGLTRLVNVVDGFVYLTNSSRTRFSELPAKPSVVVPHPRYRVGCVPVANRTVKNILFWDRSDIERKISWLARGGRSVWVRSGDADAGSPGVDVLPRRTSETDLNRLLGSGTVVIIDRFRINSGMVFHAVAQGARVLVVASPESEEVADSVGRDWVDTFAEKEWCHHHFFRSVAPNQTPSLDERDPAVVGRQLLNFMEDCSRTKGLEL